MTYSPRKAENTELRIFAWISGGWLTLVLAGGTLWIVHDARIPVWDTARHAANGLRILNLLLGVGTEHYLAEILTFYDFYPPLQYILSVPFYLAFGKTYDAGSLSVLLVWTPVLFFCCKGVAHRLLGRRSGYVAGMMAISLPIVMGLSRVFYLEVSLAGCVALALWALLRSNLLLSPRVGRAAVFGLACGLGLLSKWSFPGYIGVPLLIAAVRGMRKVPLRFVRNAMVALAITAGVGAPWYARNWDDLRASLHHQTVEVGQSDKDPNPISWASLTYYPKVIADFYLWLPLTICLAVSLALLLRSQRKKFVLLFASLIGAWVGPLLAWNKDARYIFGITPILALSISYLVGAGRSPRSRTSCLAVLVLVGSVNAYAVAIGLPGRPDVKLAGRTVLASGAYSVDPLTRTNDPSALLAVHHLKGLSACLTNQGKRLMRLRDDDFNFSLFNANTIQFLSLAQGLDMEFVSSDWDFLLTPIEQGSSLGATPLNVYGPPFKPFFLYVAPKVIEGKRGVAFFTDRRRNIFCLREAKIDRTRVAAGQAVTLRTEWYAVKSTWLANKWVYLNFSGPGFFGSPWEIQTWLWRSGTTEQDSQVIPIPPDTPPGRYTLYLGMEAASFVAGAWDGTLTASQKEMILGSIDVVER